MLRSLVGSEMCIRDRFFIVGVANHLKQSSGIWFWAGDCLGRSQHHADITVRIRTIRLVVEFIIVRPDEGVDSLHRSQLGTHCASGTVNEHKRGKDGVPVLVCGLEHERDGERHLQWKG
eukprot:TRINITY_DN20676_c0_g1_i3.p1 TRINITY_DN20676_c0_g1~~TRINITY_DN20676_c0_g1_i3.p1  ORF type:complete len:119 (-),score=18.22 TRINITY_DN20676_c0_g1_i3:235-591(-)